MTLNRRDFIKYTGRTLAGAAAASALGWPCMGLGNGKEPLNILMFTADDLACESVGCFDGKPAGLTPNIDRFAGEGMRFERAHVTAAICMPSRIAIATGLYGHHSGAMGFHHATPGTPNVTGIFQEAGYLTGILGKVDHSTACLADTWDYSFYRNELGDGRNPDIYKQRCKDFFAKCKTDRKPFYFMVNSHDPHRPFHTAGKTNKGSVEPSRTYTPEEVAVPGFLPDLPGVRDEMSTYLNSVRRCDDTFGKTMEALKESGYGDNTLVLFLSDNGIAMPFAKANCYLAATRTPLIMRWPGKIAPGTVDKKNFVSGIDFLPTMLAAAALPQPDVLDGKSILPLFANRHQKGRDEVFTQIDYKIAGPAVPMRCVQNRRYGYIFNPWSDGTFRYRNNNEGLTMKAMNEAARQDADVAARVAMYRYRVQEEFYDMQNDPDCLKNLMDAPEVAKEREALMARLREWMVETGDPALAAFDIRTDPAACKAAVEKAFNNPGMDEFHKTKNGLERFPTKNGLKGPGKRKWK